MIPARNTDRTWGWTARLLHWSMALMLLGLVGLGLWTAEVETDMYAQLELVQIHKSWGFVAFALALLRLVWRALNRTPDAPAHASRLANLAAAGGHAALYVLMFALPLTGWLMASASPLQELYGIQNMVFGLFALPDPFNPGDQDLQEALRAAHFWSAMGLLAMVGLHAAAALKHHLLDRDAVLRRMSWGG